MSKYTEAISSIYFTMHNRVKPKTLGHCEDKNLEVLEELVKKATPDKPKMRVFNDAEVWECAERLVEKEVCPSCSHRLLDKDPYCRFCGQAIDWSK